MPLKSETQESRNNSIRIEVEFGKPQDSLVATPKGKNKHYPKSYSHEAVEMARKKL